MSTILHSLPSWVWPILASFGGGIVFLGLWLEHGSEKDFFRNFNDFNRQKWKAKWGWRILMFGIFTEIVIGFALAAKDESDVRQAEINIEHVRRMRVSDLSFATKLRQIPNIWVNIRYLNEPEPRQTAANLLFAFSMANWRLFDFKAITNVPVESTPSGIIIAFPARNGVDNAVSEQAASLLSKELTDRGEAAILTSTDDGTNFLINGITVTVGRKVNPEEITNWNENVKTFDNWWKGHK